MIVLCRLRDNVKDESRAFGSVPPKWHIEDLGLLRFSLFLIKVKDVLTREFHALEEEIYDQWMKSYWDFYRTLMEITASGMKVFCRCKGWIEITKGANLLLLLTWPNRKLSQPFHILPRCRNDTTQARNGCQNFDDASQGDQLTDLIIGPNKDLTNGSIMCDWGMKKIDANVTPSELIKILWHQYAP